MSYNPFSSAVSDLTNPQAQHWYRTQATLLMTQGWNSLQYLGLLLVNRINIQLGRPPLPALTARQTPETPTSEPCVEDQATTIVDVEVQPIDLTEEPTTLLEISPDTIAAPEVEVPVPESTPAVLMTADLEAMTVQELRTLARQHQLTFADRPISKARKSQLVAALVGLAPIA